MLCYIYYRSYDTCSSSSGELSLSALKFALNQGYQVMDLPRSSEPPPLGSYRMTMHWVLGGFQREGGGDSYERGTPVSA